jgi:hypothetical protein
MSDGSFEDVGADPAARCRHLRTKMMSVVVEWDAHAAEFPSTSAAYWCLRTMGPVGPDDGPADLDDCRNGRSCYQKLP